MTDATGAPKRSLFQLIGELPGLISNLVRAELDAIKDDLKRKAIKAGIGIGLLGAALFVLLLAVVVLVIAGVAGLATVLPFWASALIIFGVLIVIAGVLVAVGVHHLKGARPDTERIVAVGMGIRSLGREQRRAAREPERGTDA